MFEEIKFLIYDLYELFVYKGCLFWGNFVIILDGSIVILVILYVVYLGIIYCVWWFGNDFVIEKIVIKC